MIIWLTGNSGSGKTTLARGFRKDNPNWIMLDGDEMRASVSLGAGFSKKERREHNLRVARLAGVLSDQGHDVLVSVIAPHRATRTLVDKVVGCYWVYVKREVVHKDDRPYQPPAKVPVIDNDVCTEDEALEQLKYIVESLT